MLAMLQIYLPITIALTIANEQWNCENPYPYRIRRYSACQWNESDMFEYKDEWHLRPRDMYDNYFERKARKKYWAIRGYDNYEIRLRSY